MSRVMSGTARSRLGSGGRDRFEAERATAMIRNSPEIMTALEDARGGGGAMRTRSRWMRSATLRRRSRGQPGGRVVN
jgi:hypothetical protein